MTNKYLKDTDEYLDREDWRVEENSNAHYSYGALSKHMSSMISADYWLERIYPNQVSSAHLEGDFHIHDLGGLTLYCCGYSLMDIIKKGVRGISNIPVSKPAKHFGSLLAQIANLTTIYQNEIMGAVAFSSFDTLIAPFVKMDNLNYKEVYQELQGFIFQINSNSRGGAEPAFSNLTLDITPSKDIIDNNVVVGGKELKFTYRECQKEMDMINLAFCEIMLKGDAEGAPFSYPINW
ncbi:MAG: anaerobic ribonucleoside-triphosphate reductase [bacterium]